ncbi:MAG: superinfection immunity protein [Thaumarchaeota archaeon]|nr:superinfection immunity protein [Nitrososphaerota archaeon]
MSILANIVAFLIFFGIYFTPTIVASIKGHKQVTAIFVLNFLLGWSLIGWSGALVWAIIKQK